MSKLYDVINELDNLVESHDIIDEKSFGKWRVTVQPSNYDDDRLTCTFYDLSQNPEKFPGGQQTPGTYYVDSLFSSKWGPSIEDMDNLRLYVGEPSWTVEHEDLVNIAEWLKQYKSDNRINENSVEEYWDATEVAREGFSALLRFNFGSDANGDNYIIVKDNTEIRRFRANNDEEAISYFNKWKDAKRDGFGSYMMDEDFNAEEELNKLAADVVDFFYEWDPYQVDNSEGELNIESAKEALSNPEQEEKLLYDLTEIVKELKDDPELKAKGEDIIKRIRMDESEKADELNEDVEENSWLSKEDNEWLINNGYDVKLDKLLSYYQSTGDIDEDTKNLNDRAVDFFYDQAHAYNEKIDSLCTKWAHDKAVELNSLNESDESIIDTKKKIAEDKGEFVSASALTNTIKKIANLKKFKSQATAIKGYYSTSGDFEVNSSDLKSNSNEDALYYDVIFNNAGYANQASKALKSEGFSVKPSDSSSTIRVSCYKKNSKINESNDINESLKDELLSTYDLKTALEIGDIYANDMSLPMDKFAKETRDNYVKDIYYACATNVTSSGEMSYKFLDSTIDGYLSSFFANEIKVDTNAPSEWRRKVYNRITTDFKDIFPQRQDEI